MKDKNYYEILGISHFSNQSEIKHAYYKLAKRYHPDINPKTANLFKQINEAYQILSDPVTRDKYDESLNLDSYIKNVERAKNKAQRRHEQKSNPNKTAEERLNELNEFLYNKVKEENFSDFYTDFKYYQTPLKESIFNIIYDWNKYRFENAIKGIWDRNFLAILGVWFVFLLGTFSILFTKIFTSFKPTERKKYNWHWISHLQNLNYINKFWKVFAWFILLAFFFISKFIFTILYCIYWIFRNIIRFFLLPVAILLVAFGKYLVWFFFGFKLFK